MQKLILKFADYKLKFYFFKKPYKIVKKYL